MALLRILAVVGILALIYGVIRVIVELTIFIIMHNQDNPNS